MPKLLNETRFSVLGKVTGYLTNFVCTQRLCSCHRNHAFFSNSANKFIFEDISGVPMNDLAPIKIVLLGARYVKLAPGVYDFVILLQGCSF